MSRVFVDGRLYDSCPWGGNTRLAVSETVARERPCPRCGGGVVAAPRERGRGGE